MRPNNPNKRLRGRNRSKNTNPLARSYESNGPDVKIRGSAMQVADKYAQLARDSQSSGDRIMAENYLQHAEHYYRIVATAYEQSGQGQQPTRERRDDGGNGRYDDRSFRGEQPSINGYDGLDDDEEAPRRPARANGATHAASHGSDDDADGEATVAAHANGDDDRDERRGQSGEAAEQTSAGRANEGEASDPHAGDQPSIEAATPGDAESEEERPKRRRAPRRPRVRRTEASGEPVPSPEATDPNS